jgi:hypothetical protein
MHFRTHEEGASAAKHIVCLALLILSTVPSVSQAKSNVDLSIRTSRSSFSPGEEIKLDVIVKNGSDQPLPIFATLGAGGAAEGANEVDVRDMLGNRLPRIDVRKLSHNGKTRTIPKPGGSQRGLVLKSGEEFRDYTLLNHLFDLSKPGIYFVTAIESTPTPSADGKSPWTSVKSNTIQIEIIAKGSSRQYGNALFQVPGDWWAIRK